LFGVYVEAQPHDVNEAVYQITNEITRLSYELTEDQVEFARHALKAACLTGMDGTTALADEIGRQVLYHGRRIHPAEIIARIDDCDAAAVRNCAVKYLQDVDVVVSGYGAVHELPDYNYVRRRTYWLRY
jgi:processing peptidase subunit beta